MAQQQSTIPSNQGLSRELIAYHQSNEARIKSLQTTVDSGVVSTIDSTSGAFTLGYGLDRSSQELLAAFSSSSAAISGNVALNNTSNYFDGPSVSLVAGTWFVMGTVTVVDTGATAAIYAKLWDGSTVFASAAGYSSNTSRGVAITLSAVVTLVATTTVKISCRDPDAATGSILFNQTGNSKDSHITAVRIA